MPTAETVDQSLVGQWTLDRDATKKAQIQVLKSAGIIKAQGDKADFERNFSSLRFSFELLPDAKFTCSMGNLFESGNFSGYWTTSEDEISMVQTREGDKKKKDRLTGTVQDGKLHLIHQELGNEIPYIFTRRGA